MGFCSLLYHRDKSWIETALGGCQIIFGSLHKLYENNPSFYGPMCTDIIRSNVCVYIMMMMTYRGSNCVDIRNNRDLLTWSQDNIIVITARIAPSQQTQSRSWISDQVHLLTPNTKDLLIWKLSPGIFIIALELKWGRTKAIISMSMALKHRMARITLIVE